MGDVAVAEGVTLDAGVGVGDTSAFVADTVGVALGAQYVSAVGDTLDAGTAVPPGYDNAGSVAVPSVRRPDLPVVGGVTPITQASRVYWLTKRYESRAYPRMPHRAPHSFSTHTPAPS